MGVKTVLLYHKYSTSSLVATTLPCNPKGELQRRKKNRGWKRIPVGRRHRNLRNSRFIGVGEEESSSHLTAEGLLYFIFLSYLRALFRKRESSKGRKRWRENEEEWERQGGSDRERKSEGVFQNRGKMEENRYSLVAGKLRAPGRLEGWIFQRMWNVRRRLSERNGKTSRERKWRLLVCTHTETSWAKWVQDGPGENG